MTQKYTIAHMHRYPLKSFGGETVQTVALRPAKSFPGDRILSLAAQNDAKTMSSLLTLSRGAPLGGLHIAYDAKKRHLRLFRKKTFLGEAHLDVAAEKSALEKILQKACGLQKTPKIMQRRKESFAFRKGLISLINLASIKALSKTLGFAVDELRFRANVYFAGSTPWEEMDWVGQNLYTQNSLRLTVREVTRRCPAIDVNPENGKQDVELLESMRAQLGHISLGVYAEVVSAGVLRTGDFLTPTKKTHVKNAR